MNSNDFVKYLTVQLVERIEKPKPKTSEPKQAKSLSIHWFGLIPVSLKIFIKRFQKNS